MRRSLATLIASVTVAAGCTGAPTGDGGSPSPPATPEGTPSPVTSPEGSPIATLASGRALPACREGSPAPAATDTVAFVSGGHAWSLSPDGSRPTCLFDVSDPGPYIWGPLGDRALLGGLMMRRVGGGVLRRAQRIRSGPASWGHPEGLAVAFTARDGSSLLKAFVDDRQIEDISPLKGATYLDVAYHPSGTALAFVVQRGEDQSIWLSSNEGEDPVRLVFSTSGTLFGGLDFTADGRSLVYGAFHPNGSSTLHALDLSDPTVAPVVWSEKETGLIDAVHEPPRSDGRTVALTLGGACRSHRALLVRGGEATDAVPGETRPTSALGWLGRTQVLVAAGGCGEPLDLSAVDVRTDAVVPLVAGVEAAAVRTRAPTPTPPLPRKVEEEVGEGVG